MATSFASNALKSGSNRMEVVPFAKSPLSVFSLQIMELEVVSLFAVALQCNVQTLNVLYCKKTSTLTCPKSNELCVAAQADATSMSFIIIV